jgi:hypothetical protein
MKLSLEVLIMMMIVTITIKMMVIADQSSQFYVNIKEKVIHEETESFVIDGISGFENINLDEDVQIDLKQVGCPSLIRNKDYIIKHPTFLDKGGLLIQFLKIPVWKYREADGLEHELLLTSLIVGKDRLQLIPKPIQIAVVRVISHSRIEKREIEILQQTNSETFSFTLDEFFSRPIFNFQFNFPLIKGLHYTDATNYPVYANEVVLKLYPGAKWGWGPGELKLMSFETEGGRIQLNKKEGMIVAFIINDENLETIPPLQVLYPELEMYPSKMPIFESNTSSIQITGDYLIPGMEFTLSNGMIQGVDFIVEYESMTSIRLHLMKEKKWKIPSENALFIVTVNVDGVKYKPSDHALLIAMVYPDPIINESHQRLYLSQSTELVISGSSLILPDGLTKFHFAGGYSPSIKVEPNEVDTNKVIFRLLKENWLVGGRNLKLLRVRVSDRRSSPISLQIEGIEVGGQRFVFHPLVTVAEVFPDLDEVICDNSCAFSFDGVCDDAFLNPIDSPRSYLNNGYGRRDTFCSLGTDCADCGGPESILRWIDPEEDVKHREYLKNSNPSQGMIASPCDLSNYELNLRITSDLASSVARDHWLGIILIWNILFFCALAWWWGWKVILPGRLICQHI